MDNALLDLAHAELKQLDAALRRWQEDGQRINTRRTAVLSLLDAYGGQFVEAPLIPSGSVLLAPSVSASVPRENSFKARVIAASETILDLWGQLRTPQLVELIQKEGIEFSAADPVANLSAILSKSGKFVPDRKNGWSLAKKSPQDAPTSAGLDTNAVSTQPPQEGPPRTGNDVQEGDQIA